MMDVSVSTGDRVDRRRGGRRTGGSATSSPDGRSAHARRRGGQDVGGRHGGDGPPRGRRHGRDDDPHGPLGSAHQGRAAADRQGPQRPAAAPRTSTSCSSKPSSCCSEVAGSWSPEGGAMPWVWARQRLANVVDGFLGQLGTLDRCRHRAAPRGRADADGRVRGGRRRGGPRPARPGRLHRRRAVPAGRGPAGGPAGRGLRARPARVPRGRRCRRRRAIRRRRTPSGSCSGSSPPRSGRSGAGSDALNAARPTRRARRRPCRSGARRMTPGRASRPLDGALDRHPAGRDRRRDLLGLARVVARRLEHDGAAHPAVGAAALASRGVRADDRVRRAAAWGLTDACPGRRRGRCLSARVGPGTAAAVEPVRRAARRARARGLVMPSPGGEGALGTFAATVEQGSRDGARSPGSGGEGQG